MASFVYAVWSITNVASVHCAVRPEISPCTCEPFMANKVELSCEKVDSFHQIVDALSNKFAPNISISLLISHSQLEDLEMRSFSEMNLNVQKLRLISDNLRSVPETTFRGMSNIEFLSLAENELEEIPKHVLNHLPKLKTLDLGKGRIKAVQQDDYKGVPNIRYLILVSNNITRLDKDSFPKNLFALHLGRNNIQTLNGTLRDLLDLESLFINMNNISSLENELPPASNNLKMILATNNSLERLPQSMKEYPKLDSVFFNHNKLKSLDGVFKNSKYIMILHALNNQIEYLAEDEFLEAELMEELDLAHNNIKSLNKSLLPLTRLKNANFSFNNLEEFSMNEIRGLEFLTHLDISYNKIRRLTGRMENLIEPNSFLVELRMHYNNLTSLDGALTGLNRLKVLNLAHNSIERILPDDLIGLESLEVLDLSFNQLLTLEETSTTFLPSLKTLKAAYNNLTSLEKDFHGLPILCQANLTHNHITSISSELVSKTRCNNHGVPGKLEIWLENNPIMCDERLTELCPLMESQEARIRGRTHCLETPPSHEICTAPPIILKAPLPLIPQIIQTQLHQVGNNPAIVSQPSIVQVIVPAPLVAPKAIMKELSPSTTSTTTTTTTTTATTTETSVPLSTTPAPPATPSSTTVSSIDSHLDYSTIEYAPLIESDIPQLSSESEDNSVHEQFSQPLVVLPGPESSQLLLIPEEPPELS